MPILIDGHNLIGRLPAISLHDPDDEDKLVRLLTSYRARTSKRIIVVFDPGAGFSTHKIYRRGGIEVMFARHGSSADAVIQRRVRRSRNPQEWLVVTSDQELAQVVAQWGARIRSAEAFATELGMPLQLQPEEKDILLSPEEVEAWLALFGDEEAQGGDVRVGPD